jgi:Methyltransferase domain
VAQNWTQKICWFKSLRRQKGGGKPVSQTLALAGFEVFGVDVSREMVNIAQKQVTGVFQKSDMTKFQLTRSFSAIFAIFSLFQLSHAQTYSMIFKFSEWLKPGGILVVGTIPSVSWVPDPNLDIIAKQIVKHTLLGPYFLPESYRGPCPLSEGGWKPFRERSTRSRCDAVLEILTHNKRVLNVRSDYVGISPLPLCLAVVHCCALNFWLLSLNELARFT